VDNGKDAVAHSIHLLCGDGMITRLQQISATDFNADAGDLQFDARLTPLLPTLFPSVPTTLDRDALAIPIGGFDAFLLADRAGALLPAHPFGTGLLGKQCCRGHRHGGDSKRIEHHPHE
jgi:hypothetical protein